MAHSIIAQKHNETCLLRQNVLLNIICLRSIEIMLNMLYYSAMNSK